MRLPSSAQSWALRRVRRSIVSRIRRHPELGLEKIGSAYGGWIVPTRLPEVPSARWMPEIDYFTFLPDFLSAGLQRALEPIEAALERSRVRHWSAHYLARLTKHG